MYSIFFSMIEQGIDSVSDKLKEIIKPESKVAIFPWAFPVEINSEKLKNDFFSKDGKRYRRYIDSLKKVGIKEENCVICDCYADTKEKLKEIIKNSDVLLLPGGNPEMFFSKVVHGTEILYDIKYYKKTIIGESAGAELQLKRYFITAENNFYKYFAFYDGFGVLDDPFYMDVHTQNKKEYIDNLRQTANKMQKNIYAIYNDGCMIYNRENKKIEYTNNVLEISPEE